MPCSSCGSKDHNKRTCPKAEASKPATPPAAAPRRAEPRRAKSGSRVLDQVHELEDRARARLLDIDEEVKVLQMQIQGLQLEAGELRRFLEPRTERVAAAG